MLNQILFCFQFFFANSQLSPGSLGGFYTIQEINNNLNSLVENSQGYLNSIHLN